MRILKDLKKENLKGKRVILRVDFNVPMPKLSFVFSQTAKLSRLIPESTPSALEDDFRINAHKETINFLLSAGAKVLLVTHHSDKNFSFENYVDQIGEILGQKLVFLKDLNSISTLNGDSIFLLDNIRLLPGEEENDKNLAEKFSQGFDFYINDAFSVCHRKHASISAITEFLPSYVGFLIEKEISELSKILESPADGKILIIGGGKVGTKAPLVKNFLNKAEKILIGGAVANNFFKAKGLEVGKSIIDENYIDELQSILDHSSILTPEDIIVSSNKEGGETSISPVGSIDPNNYILDIGPKTAESFADLILKAKMAVWNGPMGIVEVEAFAEGTKKLIKAMGETKARTIIGGEDTISAFKKFGKLDDIDFISTGGGAMLDFLAGNKLPGLEALGYYND